MSETQVLMTVSIFFIFFLGITSWKRALLLSDVGVEGMGVVLVLIEEIFKIVMARGDTTPAPPPCPLPLWEILDIVAYGPQLC